MNFRRNLVIFDSFILTLVEMYDITQCSSLILNCLLNGFCRFKYNKLYDSYLEYDRISSANVSSSMLVLYWLNGVAANTIVKRYYVDYFVRCVSRKKASPSTRSVYNSTTRFRFEDENTRNFCQVFFSFCLYVWMACLLIQKYGT